MPPCGVDPCHLFPEHLAVGGSVAYVVEPYPIVDHLMENGVFELRFRQVETGAEPEPEIVADYMPPSSPDPAAAGPERTFRTPEPNRNLGQLSIEELPVEAVEAGLGERKREYHVSCSDVPTPRRTSTVRGRRAGREGCVSGGWRGAGRRWLSRSGTSDSSF